MEGYIHMFDFINLQKIKISVSNLLDKLDNTSLLKLLGLSIEKPQHQLVESNDNGNYFGMFERCRNCPAKILPYVSHGKVITCRMNKNPNDRPHYSNRGSIGFLGYAHPDVCRGTETSYVKEYDKVIYGDGTVMTFNEYLAKKDIENIPSDLYCD